MNEFYPLGTVVRLKGDEGYLMITGRVTGTEDTLYDYSGVIFPIGVQGSDYYFFDADDIEEVSFVGFQDAREIAFNKSLVEGIQKLISEE